MRIRVGLPPHLRTLSGVTGEAEVEVGGEGATLREALDALEAAHPVLRGTIRDHGSGERRAMIRFFACGRDLSHEPMDTALPGEVVAGDEALDVVGAIAGG